jgi:hypothetical protein
MKRIKWPWLRRIIIGGVSAAIDTLEVGIMFGGAVVAVPFCWMFTVPVGATAGLFTELFVKEDRAAWASGALAGGTCLGGLIYGLAQFFLDLDGFRSPISDAENTLLWGLPILAGLLTGAATLQVWRLARRFIWPLTITLSTTPQGE